MRRQHFLTGPRRVGVQLPAEGGLGGEVSHQDRESPQRQPGPAGVVSAPPGPVVEVVDGLEVGLHRVRVVAEQAEEADQPPVEPSPIAFA